MPFWGCSSISGSITMHYFRDFCTRSLTYIAQKARQDPLYWLDPGALYLPRNSFFDGDMRGRIKAGEFCAGCTILSFPPTSTVFTVKNTCLALSLISFGQILLQESAIPISEAENGHELTLIPFWYMYVTLIGVILFLLIWHYIAFEQTSQPTRSTLSIPHCKWHITAKCCCGMLLDLVLSGTLSESQVL